VVGDVEGGEWLKVNVQTPDGGQSIAYAARFFRDPSSDARLEAFVPSGAPELLEPLAPAHDEPSGSSAVARTEAALQQLVSLRRRYEQLAHNQRDGVRAQTSRQIELVMQELDFLGVPFEQVLNCQDPMALLLRGRSFPHRDFSNPESCSMLSARGGASPRTKKSCQMLQSSAQFRGRSEFVLQFVR